MTDDKKNKPFNIYMARCIVLFFLMLLSLSGFSQSESYNFSKLNTFTGLSHNEVNTILKDADGFLWFGTIDGLNRYDGYSYKIFRKRYNDKPLFAITQCTSFVSFLIQKCG